MGSSGPPSMSRRIPRGMACDGLVVGYASWTIAANAVVIGRGTPQALTWAALAAVVLLVSAAAIGFRKRSRIDAYLSDVADEPAVLARAPTRRAMLLMLLPPVLTLLGWLTTRNPWLAWAGIALSSSLAAWQSTREPMAFAPPTADRPTGGAYEQAILYALACGCALFTLLAVRWRADDTFYLSMARAVVDYPREPLLRAIHLHGPVSALLGPQPMFPPYWVHSFELLGGLIGKLSGADPAYVIHFGFATLLGWLTPFAVARLMRVLAPRHVLLATCATVAFYLVEGSASRGYANHAFVRMFDGKSALLTVGVPLICAYGLRYGARPSRIRLLLLLFSQIAAVGLSSTGLWLAPTLAMVSVAAGAPSAGGLPRRLVMSLVSSGYVLALGLWVMGQLSMGGGVSVGGGEAAEPDHATEAGEIAAAAPQVDSHFAELGDAISTALGPERTAIGLLGLALLAGPLSPNLFGLRLFSLLALVVSAGFGNPLWARLVAHYVVGASTYLRIFWLLPVAVAFGVCGAALLSVLQARLNAILSSALVVGVLGAGLASITTRWVFSPANHITFEFPPVLKLPAGALRVAREVCKLAPSGKYVLATQSVLQQLPLLRGCGYPLMTFDRWMQAPSADKQARDDLVRYVSKRGDLPLDRAAWFVGALSHYHPDVIVLTRDGVANAIVKSLVRMASYERAFALDSNQIFVRTRPATLQAGDETAQAVCQAAAPTARTLAPFEVAAALERRGCATAVNASDRVLAASPVELDELLRLERATRTTAHSSKAEAARLAAALARRDVAVVVLTEQARDNSSFKQALLKLGFLPSHEGQAATIYVREAPAAGE